MSARLNPLESDVEKEALLRELADEFGYDLISKVLPPSSSLPTFDVRCPDCQRVVGTQPITVTFMGTKFDCRHCDYSGELVIRN
jgi:hypothetical protein